MKHLVLPRVIDAPGLPLHLRCAGADGGEYVVEISPTTALRLAEDLLAAARRRLDGRP